MLHHLLCWSLCNFIDPRDSSASFRREMKGSGVLGHEGMSVQSIACYTTSALL